MFRKHLDSFVRNAVSASRIQFEDRRSGQERRQCSERRRETRSGVEKETDRRGSNNRRKEESKGPTLN